MKSKRIIAIFIGLLAVLSLLSLACSDQNVQKINEASTQNTPQEDATITARVEARLLSDPKLTTREISVETDNGAVTLRGTVENQAEETHALDLAQNSEGVREVSSDLAVKSELSTESGEGIGDTIEEGLSTAGEKMKDGLEKTGEVIKEGTDQAGDAVEKGMDETGEAVEESVDQATEEARDAALTSRSKQSM